ncbi:MAG: hypothetical protein K0R76_1240 [Alphaproteobacteria bacterium]|jgi:hypothetical protein|nr:hypothetical protein [Alphaproteobacteria bacterium]
MRFDRGLRSAMVRPYPSGYMAMPTDDGNREKAFCQFGGVKDPGVWLGEEALPAVIDLHVRLTPVWVENEEARAKLGRSAACFLYPRRSVFSKVKVEALGTGHYQKASEEGRVPFVGVHFSGYRLILPESFLYQKNFQGQPEGRLVHQDPSERGADGLPCLWAYGANQVGEDIHPFVFTLESLRDETFIQASSLLFWRERGIDPFRGGGVFQDVFEEDHTRTLFESIEAGMSVIHLEVGIDERGQPFTVPYRSCRLSNNYIFYKKEA